MGAIPRNAIKGYSYQQSIFVLFLALMDTEHKISKITVEATDTKNFDDIYLGGVHGDDSSQKSYRIQVKNYPEVTLENIAVENNELIIRGSKNTFDPADNNILVVNSLSIVTDDNFMGLACTEKEGITIIPITPEQVAQHIDNMFSKDERALEIIHKADDITQNAKFEITIDELPEVIQMTVDLENETILLRNVADQINRDITFIEGKPGVGKSHFVNEICEKYPEAIVYRFWTGSQDPYINRRIQFDSFISEMGIKVYQTTKRVDEDELISAIRNEDKIIIIDGLDHVENYNPSQLEKFIGFINKMTNIRVIVLSRPLRQSINWNKHNLLDWSFEETRVYLELAHEIFDYEIHLKIFNVANGYPIITYYLAEAFKLNGTVDIVKQPIREINEYYDTLFINGDKPSSAIGIFASGNCFFTWNELKSFFIEPEIYDVIKQFVEQHPYLFKQVLNRVSLIHDSLNTYLRIKISTFSQRKEKTVAAIRESLLSGSVEYMARMQSFAFDEEFYVEILRKYSDFDEFNKLIVSTQDYNSIQSLYLQLQKMLKSRKAVLDIYQYYSFALLFEVTQRNDLIGFDSLVYQMLKYMYTHEGIEEHIYSSDYIWQVYLTCTNHGKMTEQYLANRNMSESQYSSLLESLIADASFFEKKYKVISYENFEQEINEKEYQEKTVLLADYFISVWIRGDHSARFYTEFIDYINGNQNSVNIIYKELSQRKINKFCIQSALSSAKYQLHELGYFGENNKFRNHRLEEIIRQGAASGCYNATTLAASYLKLANYEKRDVDICSLAYAWTMYYEHKDYSVSTIDTAFLIFEDKGLICEEDSFEIIVNLMKQSDKGISNLLTSYANKKGSEYIRKLNACGYFVGKECRIRFWELNTELYNCFSKSDMAYQITELLRYHYNSKTLDYSDVDNSFKSKYKDMILDGIEYYGYSILSPDENIIQELDARDIKYIGTAKENKGKYIPLEYGCIHYEDFEYIKEKGISYLEVAKLSDGWYTCLPYVEVFSIYDKQDIKDNYLEIIHNAMFARGPSGDYIGYWYFLIGNILELLNEYEIEIEWTRLYSIFKGFLEVSMIWYPR
ncbi:MULTISPECIES: ATP-binding protein [unclassified Clostridium]|uniref:ATP-binding protein n=1 Tax=unclassified Clostridium TaxID=2614128 RepID=UPI00207A5761|nr:MULTISPECIES: ATP-binding protein [unclassified Clostridium]